MQSSYQHEMDHCNTKSSARWDRMSARCDRSPRDPAILTPRDPTWLHNVAEEAQGGPIQIRLTPSLQASGDDLVYHLGVMYLIWATCTSFGLWCNHSFPDDGFRFDLICYHLGVSRWLKLNQLLSTLQSASVDVVLQLHWLKAAALGHADDVFD